MKILPSLLVLLLGLFFLGCKNQEEATTTTSTSQATDSTAPVVSDGSLSSSAVTTSGLTLTWTQAEDETSQQSALVYQVYASTSGEMTSLAEIQSLGTAQGDGVTGASATSISGLSSNTTYYFNLVVTDEAGNQAIYNSLNQTTKDSGPTSPVLSINSGATSTTSRTVTLTLGAQDDLGISAYLVTESSSDASADSAGWVSVTKATNYSGSVAFELSKGDGSKTLYAWYKDSSDQVSSSATASITLGLAKAMTSFAFTSALNGSLSANATGVISGSNIYVSVPRSTSLTALIPTFASTGAKVKVSNVQQTSGSNSQDFSNGLTYVVEDSDGYSTSYSVKVYNQQLVPDTNQTTGYTSVYGEDADYSLNTPSYTDNGTTITDHVTGLIWQKADSGSAMTYDSAISYCSGLTLDSASDWRLPSINEMVMVADFSKYNPSLPAVFSNSTTAPEYWSGTVYASNSLQAYTFYTYSVQIYTQTKTYTKYARCVRGTEKTQQMVGLDSNYFFEPLTNLHWALDTNYNYPGFANSWEGALQACQNLVKGGYSDWRLPTVKELFSLFVPTGSSTGYVPSAMGMSYGNNLITSTTSPVDIATAFQVSFFNGSIWTSNKGSTSGYFCVRTGN